MAPPHRRCSSILHQIWKTQGFRGTRIYFGTLRNLYQCQHPGKNPSTLDYTRAAP